MVNFNYSVILDEQGNVKKKVRLIKYNSKILAFSINKPEVQSFFNSVDEFLDTVRDCDASIFEDLTGENIFKDNSPEINNTNTPINFANALTFHVIPEKRSQIRYD